MAPRPTRALETATCMAERARQPQPRSRRSGHEAVEFRHSKVVKCIKGAPERVIIEMARLHAWGTEARAWLILQKMEDEGELLVEKAQAMEPHGFDRMPGGHNPHFRGLLGGSIHDFSDTEFCQHPCDQAQVISDLGTVRWRR
jgi:hypothetical protein